MVLWSFILTWCRVETICTDTLSHDLQILLYSSQFCPPFSLQHCLCWAALHNKIKDLVCLIKIISACVSLYFPVCSIYSRFNQTCRDSALRWMSKARVCVDRYIQRFMSNSTCFIFLQNSRLWSCPEFCRWRELQVLRSSVLSQPLEFSDPSFHSQGFFCFVFY